MGKILSPGGRTDTPHRARQHTSDTRGRPPQDRTSQGRGDRQRTQRAQHSGGDRGTMAVTSALRVVRASLVTSAPFELCVHR